MSDSDERWSAATARAFLAVLLGVTALVLCGCRSKDSPSEPPATQSLSSPLTATTATAAAVQAAAAASGPNCTGAGDPTLGISSSFGCSGALAAATFTRAICSCGTIQGSGSLTTDGFDSSVGTPNAGLGADVAANSNISWATASNIGGNVWTPVNLTSSKASTVRGDLRLGGTLSGSGTFTVNKNATVVKTLPTFAKVLGTTTKVSSVAAPCACSAPLATASITAAHKATSNDNATINLSSTAFVGTNPTTLDLPCGNYYLTQINATKALTINVHGHTALYVDGNVASTQALTVQVDATATLDLFVAGTFSVQSLTLGSAAHPNNCRLYVAGNKFSTTGAATYGCNVYAPSAPITVASNAVVYGSLFGSTVTLSGNATVHYDTKVLSGGSECCSVAGCNDSSACTTDACTGNGTCSHAAVANGTTCSDSNGCTKTDTCQAGVCTGASPVVCTAADACHTVGTCNPANGTCSSPVAANGTTCSDGNACTKTDSCQAGVCTGASPVVCTASDACHVAGTCNTATGTCSNPTAPNGTTCSDGNACTKTDSCQAGVCTGASPVVCTASDACHVAGTCNTANGTCSNPAAVDGASCSDGNACNGSESCTQGACIGGASPVVNDGNPCTADSCDPVTGVKNAPVAAGTACSDGNACNGAELCNATGACVAGTPPVLDDGKPCTTDTCDATTGVLHTPVTAGVACDDGDACNGHEACNATGACANGTPIAVDDGDPCTADFCDAQGVVSHTLKSFDDGNPCTADACDASSGVITHQKAAEGTACDDQTVCNGHEVCSSTGSCLPGTPLVLDDHNPCTQDGCNPVTGLIATSPLSVGTPCADAILCNGTETCDGQGTCTPGVTLPTDDGDPCTIDSCDALGVKHVRSTTAGCGEPGQWQTLVSSQPSPRDGAAGVFTNAGELFLFGGENAGASLADGWLWSAARNGWRRAASGPSARSGVTAAFDSQRQRVIVFGGVNGAHAGASYNNEVWEYAPLSNTWVLRSAGSVSPAPRALASFAYDSSSQRGLLFGGVGPTHLADTWEWNGATGSWTQIGGSGPSPRFGSAFAFDPAHHVYVLFGGSPQGVTGGALDDTWSFDANVGLWSQRAPAQKPPARAGATMTYDARASKLVMLGGTSASTLNADDAWEFDAASGAWTRLGTGSSPGRTGNVAGFDSSTGQLLLATGIDFSDSGRFSTDQNSIWTYSRSSQQWTSRSSASAPGRIGLAAVYNPDTGTIVTRAAVEQSDSSTRPMMWDYDGATRQWFATDASASQTNFSAGAFKEVSNVVNGLLYDSSRRLTLQVTTIQGVGSVQDVVRIREWDGVRWSYGCNLTSQPGGIGMDKGSAIFDPVRKRVLLFGGINSVTVDPSTCAVTAQRADSIRNRESAAVGYDPERDVFVLFGGASFSEPQADTWEYNPTTGALAAGGSGPSARVGASIAFDSVRKKLVMYGGAFGSGPARRDTWEYSVSSHSWAQLSASGGPDSTRAWIVFDEKRRQLTLVGTDGSIWTWDGADWNQELSSVAPSARSGMTGGWDPTLGAGLFFGGLSGDGRRAFLSDLWMWSGGWHQLSAPGNPAPLTWGNGWRPQSAILVSVGPAARTGHVFATGYAGSSAALLFGGEGDNGLLGDTWTLDEATLQWQARPAPNTFSDPSARTGHAATAFPGIGYLMFGGLGRTGTGQDTLLNDTWSWSSGWSQVNTFNAAPSARFAHAMATDTATNKVILFGGRDASGVLGDTWMLDLNTLQSAGWKKLSPSTTPRPRFGHAMSYDTARQRIVLTGGEGAVPGTAFGDTWEWDPTANNWVKRNVGAMDGRAGQVAFYDRRQAQTVVFGGLAHDANGQASRTYGDTLAFIGANQVDPPALKDNGDKCSAGGVCASGSCVDGVCCDTACTGQCAACDVAGFEGTCTAATGTPHGTRAACAGPASTCGPRCDGTDTAACHVSAVGTSCGAAAGCNAGSLIQGPGVCDGLGACPQAAVSCLPYGCFGPPDLPTSRCMTSCQTDGYCFSADYRCSRPGGVCYLAAKLAPNAISVSPIAPKVGTPLTITVKPLIAGSNYIYNFNIYTATGPSRFPCIGTSSTTCVYTPQAADVGLATFEVKANAPAAQTDYDATQIIRLTIGAAQ